MHRICTKFSYRRTATIIRYQVVFHYFAVLFFPIYHKYLRLEYFIELSIYFLWKELVLRITFDAAWKWFYVNSRMLTMWNSNVFPRRLHHWVSISVAKTRKHQCCLFRALYWSPDLYMGWLFQLCRIVFKAPTLDV